MLKSTKTRVVYVARCVKRCVQHSHYAHTVYHHGHWSAHAVYLASGACGLHGLEAAACGILLALLVLAPLLNEPIA